MRCRTATTPYTRDELINIRGTTAEDLFPSFIARCGHSVHKVRCCRRGKQAGMLLHLHRLRTPLQGIFLSNISSLGSKIDELQLLMGKNRDHSKLAVLCFMETWLSESILDSVVQLVELQLFRADCHMEFSGKTKGGGICFCTYSGWCNDVTVIQQHCSPHLDSTAHPFSNFSISLETSLPTWKRCKQTRNRTPRKQQDQAQCLHPPWSPVLIRDMSCASLLPQGLSFLFQFCF